MMSLTVNDQLSALRSVVFGAIDAWNATHPHPLRSRKERGAVNVTHAYTDASNDGTYLITVVCAPSGSAQLTFHGDNLADVAEHARLTLEQKIAMQSQRRAGKTYDHEFDSKYGVAI